MDTTQWPISITLPVLWGDMDAFQHVNNVRYIRWFECARIEYFMKIADGQLLSNQQIGPILAHIEADYLSPITFPDQITVQTNISQIGRTSFTMEYLITSQKNKRPAAKGMGVIVMINYQTGEKITIDETLMTRIEELQGKVQSLLPGR